MTVPREPVGRDADLERIHDAFRHGGTSEGFVFSQVMRLCREARDERDALREAAREYLTFTSHVVGPQHVVDSRKRLEVLVGEPHP